MSLRQRLQTLEGGNTSSSVGMVTTDFCNSIALASSSSTPTWVIDSGATDHVTGMWSIFHLYVQSSNGRIRIANGTFTQVAGEGSIDVLPNLSLASVLHVPQFSFNNLVSFRSLTKTHNCSVAFCPSHCVFQDLRTRQKIDGGHESNGLYILDPI